MVIFSTYFNMCGEPLNRLCHWGPIIALIIVKIVGFTTYYNATMWWPPHGSLGGFLHSLFFIIWNGLVLYNFFAAIFIGPGFVALNWQPEDSEDKQYLQYCEICQGYKPPRSHHCRRCKRCVLKMDHHCPWINACCGHRNQVNFTLFLLYAVCGSLHASVVLSCSLYRALYRNWHIMYRIPPIVYLDVTGFMISLFALGLAIGVILALGVLFIIQFKSIMKNETAVENWIVTKAKRPRPEGEVFIFPYNLGWKVNLKNAFCAVDRFDDDDGVIWPIVEGCNQFTLTIEQIKQKAAKKLRMKEYTIIEDYSGAIFPITKGFKVFFTPPYSDDPRIPLKPGDKVLVSRWKKFWLYGWKTGNEKPSNAGVNTLTVKGWFPRRCAVELADGGDDGHLKILNKKQKKKKS
ncbi:hypothetical protein CHUAL_002563 [Chamberlinius hualienensis]